jgi:adenylylsulfate kinase
MFVGQPGSGKTVLGKMMVDFLQTEKRNWRKSVFHIDGDELRAIFTNNDYTDEGRKRNIQNAHSLIRYLHSNGCDVVVSMVAPFRDMRDGIKSEFAGEVEEIYLSTNKKLRQEYHVPHYEEPTENFTPIDTTKDSPTQSFSKIINILRSKNMI